MNDDQGDQFPGALPAGTTTAPSPDVEDRLVPMHAAYIQKANSVVEAGREGIAHELAQTFADEFFGAFASGAHVDPARARRAGRRTASRGQSGRPAGQARLGRMGRFTRSSLERFDRYTLEVFNPGAPYRSRDDS